MFFTALYRESVREAIISKAKEDKRIVSAAAIGSYARGEVDRWSDIDLTFGVREAYPISEIIESWTDYIIREFSGSVLFDTHFGKTTYRVFVLPICLQLDLSFSRETEFGAIRKPFQLLFGKQYEKRTDIKPQATTEIFGIMVHHLLRARICAERNRLWQGQFWISQARNYALKLACISRGLESDYGRGFDTLPNEILLPFRNSLVCKLTKGEILRALKEIIELLPIISEHVNQLSRNFGATLKELVSSI